METKIIPFDLETAKKIQAGEIEGKIKSPYGIDVRIICWDKMCYGDEYPIVALVKGKIQEAIYEVNVYGEVKREETSLTLEVPDNEPQFKPFDKVLVRNCIIDKWWCALFSHYSKNYQYPYAICDGRIFVECIPYEGNEHLVGTTDKPEGN